MPLRPLFALWATLAFGAVVLGHSGRTLAQPTGVPAPAQSMDASRFLSLAQSSNTMQARASGARDLTRHAAGGTLTGLVAKFWRLRLIEHAGGMGASELGGGRMILNALVEKLKRRSKDDFKGRHFEAALILQAVSWYLRYPLSYRDIEELFLERGLEVDHSTLNRWVLAYAPLIERRLRTFRKPHCGSIRVDETYIKIRGQWRYLYRAIDKHGNPVDFLLTAKRDLEAAKRFFRKALQDQPLLSPDRIGTDGAGSYPPAIAAARKDGLLARTPVHYVTKHLQQGIESDHFRVKRPMPRVGCFQAFHTARRTIQGFEAMLWLRKGFGFAGRWTVCEQNRLLALSRSPRG